MREADVAKRLRATGTPRRAARAVPGSWQKDPEGRRERVLIEAARLFAERGFASVTTGQIAAAASVAEGNVFHYFGSKQNLLGEVGARWGRDFAAAMFEGVEPQSGRAVIEGMVRRAFAFVETSHAGFGLFLLSGDPALGPTAAAANREVVTTAVERMLEVWEAAGVAHVGDAGIVAHLLFGLMESALRASLRAGEGARRERYIEEVVTALLRMLEPGNGESRV